MLSTLKHAQFFCRVNFDHEIDYYIEGIMNNAAGLKYNNAEKSSNARKLIISTLVQ